MPVGQVLHRLRWFGRGSRTAWAVALTAVVWSGVVTTAAVSAGRVRGIEAIDVAPVWAGHPVGFALVTAGDRQYVAYYAADRHLTVAARDLAGDEWTFFRLPSAQPGPPTEPGQTSAVLGWDSHNGIAMAADGAGHLHLAGNMHNNGLTYYRTQVPATIETFEQVPAMVGREEKRCTYPMFLTRTDGLLLFRYRSGGSGNGRDYFNAYDESDRSWRRLFEEPFFDGDEERSAYAHQPILGPDGRYHLSWVWRDTPDCSTNHDLGYARSSDLIEWETIDGRGIALPIRLDTPGIVVDPVPVEGGILNGTGRVGFDSRSRPVLAYYKYDPAGRSQAFVARHEGDAWQIRQVSDWNDRFELTGRGSLPTAHISLGAVESAAKGELRLAFSHAKEGTGVWLLADESLAVIRTERASPKSLPAELTRVESSFPGMAVRTADDQGASGIPGRRFVLRWETLNSNRDQPHEDPWPEPSMLRVVEVDDSPGAEYP
jgi:hypothetical protein